MVSANPRIDCFKLRSVLQIFCIYFINPNFATGLSFEGQVNTVRSRGKRLCHVNAIYLQPRDSSEDNERSTSPLN